MASGPSALSLDTAGAAAAQTMPPFVSPRRNSWSPGLSMPAGVRKRRGGGSVVPPLMFRTELAAALGVPEPLYPLTGIKHNSALVALAEKILKMVLATYSFRRIVDAYPLDAYHRDKAYPPYTRPYITEELTGEAWTLWEPTCSPNSVEREIFLFLAQVAKKEAGADAAAEAAAVAACLVNIIARVEASGAASEPVVSTPVPRRVLLKIVCPWSEGVFGILRRVADYTRGIVVKSEDEGKSLLRGAERAPRIEGICSKLTEIAKALKAHPNGAAPPCLGPIRSDELSNAGGEVKELNVKRAQLLDLSIKAFGSISTLVEVVGRYRVLYFKEERTEDEQTLLETLGMTIHGTQRRLLDELEQILEIFAELRNDASLIRKISMALRSLEAAIRAKPGVEEGASMDLEPLEDLRALERFMDPFIDKQMKEFQEAIARTSAATPRVEARSREADASEVLESPDQPSANYPRTLSCLLYRVYDITKSSIKSSNPAEIELDRLMETRIITVDSLAQHKPIAFGVDLERFITDYFGPLLACIKEHKLVSERAKEFMGLCRDLGLLDEGDNLRVDKADLQRQLLILGRVIDPVSEEWRITQPKFLRRVDVTRGESQVRFVSPIGGGRPAPSPYEGRGSVPATGANARWQAAIRPPTPGAFPAVVQHGRRASTSDVVAPLQISTFRDGYRFLMENLFSVLKAKLKGYMVEINGVKKDVGVVIDELVRDISIGHDNPTLAQIFWLTPDLEGGTDKDIGAWYLGCLEVLGFNPSYDETTKVLEVGLLPLSDLLTCLGLNEYNEGDHIDLLTCLGRNEYNEGDHKLFNAMKAKLMPMLLQGAGAGLMSPRWEGAVSARRSGVGFSSPTPRVPPSSRGAAVAAGAFSFRGHSPAGAGAAGAAAGAASLLQVESAR